MRYYCKERLDEINYGYDMDCGGYSFEEAEGFHDLPPGTLVAEGDFGEYVDAREMAMLHGVCEEDLTIFFDPDSNYVAWPESLVDAWDAEIKLISKGVLFSTDHDCYCQGYLDICTTELPLPWTKVAGWLVERGRSLLCGIESVPVKDLADGVYWKFTGNCDDAAYPDCERCGGEGTLESPGGAYAIYAPIGAEETDDE